MTMTITLADARIVAATEAGLIDAATAARAQDAIRQSVYYGQRMSPRDRRSVVELRFGLTLEAIAESRRNNAA